MKSRLILITAVMALSAPFAYAQEPATSQPASATADKPQTVTAEYPDLASAGLTYACLADLPDGVLLAAGGVSLKREDLEAEIMKTPQALQDQLHKNSFFLLEQMATRQLLLQEAKAAAAKDGKDALAPPEKELFQTYFDNLTAGAKVSDEEIADFYAKNKDMVGDQALEAVKDAIGKYLLQQKQQEIVDRHIRTLGERITIQLAAPWVKQQAVLAKDNPVDKVRGSGKPSLVDFGSKGCRPCDMLAPILETLKKKYDGRANVIFVSAPGEQILAARYGIQSIPVQIFYDAGGKEVFRHVGFWPQEELEKKLAELGVK